MGSREQAREASYRGQTPALARHIELGTERRDVRDRITDRKHAALQ